MGEVLPPVYCFVCIHSERSLVRRTIHELYLGFYISIIMLLHFAGTTGRSMPVNRTVPGRVLGPVRLDQTAHKLLARSSSRHRSTTGKQWERLFITFTAFSRVHVADVRRVQNEVIFMRWSGMNECRNVSLMR